uniref:Uncharacterized protein n=1 Tax=Tremella fuciformis TaxID=64657 RepID=A0A2H4QBT4_9TREE|nr:hypothetical protein [Tremella fuciformis]ATX62038.1 hypothetical protein [Tremella fuciformis]
MMHLIISHLSILIPLLLLLKNHSEDLFLICPQKLRSILLLNFLYQPRILLDLELTNSHLRFLVIYQKDLLNLLSSRIRTEFIIFVIKMAMDTLVHLRICMNVFILNIEWMPFLKLIYTLNFTLV